MTSIEYHLKVILGIVSGFIVCTSNIQHVYNNEVSIQRSAAGMSYMMLSVT